ncbi:hypothetical protein LEP1GSC059_2767 [Leptospira noguchii serovar Panama str. CZ214]|uniref:Uncharacterized protein n=1 Tax=Leptospira noguchii serovar Panama str. CZ214 TaxID=1001595 RepID=T0GV49_9LEPT|nr:hypothetical protein LEP1GSC059_2767 [Leptospira noguchii serovar Panama str. CZ214]
MNFNRIVEKLILHSSLFYGSVQLKKFVYLDYGIFKQL